MRNPPQIGDRVLSCGHLRERIHWFRFEPAQEFTRSDGTFGAALWFAECEPCGRQRNGGPALESVRDDWLYQEGDPEPVMQPVDDQPAYIRGW